MSISCTCPLSRQKGGWRERKMEGEWKRKRKEAIKKFPLLLINALFTGLPIPTWEQWSTYSTHILILCLFTYFPRFVLTVECILEGHCMKKAVPVLLFCPPVSLLLLPPSITHFALWKACPSSPSGRAKPSECLLSSIWMIALLTWLHGTHTHMHSGQIKSQIYTFFISIV